MNHQSVSKIEILPLTSDYADQSIGVLCRAFLDEPMMSFLKITYQELHQLFEPRVRLTLEDRLSLILLEEGKCVSVMLNDDFSEAYEEIPMPGAMRPVFELLTLMHDNQIEHEMKKSCRRVLHFFCGATLPEARKKGYLGLVTREGYGLAKNRGFDDVMVEATSPYTQRLCRGQGFETINSRLNSSFPAFAEMGEARVDIMRLDLHSKEH